jgi:chemotaxis protein MotB
MRHPTTHNLSRAFLLTLLAATTAGCVAQGTYDQAVAKTEVTQAQLEKTKTALSQSDAELARSREAIAAQQAKIDAYNKVNEETKGALSKSSQSIEELRARLEELKAARAASEVRAALFRSLALKLKEQVDAGELQIVLRDGRMVLQLPNDVLFDSGHTELKPAGQKALKAITAVLKTMPERQFQVAGHTDNVPIHNDKFASNWELSSGRALRVVHLMISEGMVAKELSAAGYSDVDPVAANASAEGRRSNRRTEITLQPNIAEMVPVP